MPSCSLEMGLAISRQTAACPLFEEGLSTDVVGTWLAGGSWWLYTAQFRERAIGTDRQQGERPGPGRHMIG